MTRNRRAFAPRATTCLAMVAIVAGSHVGSENPVPVSGVVPFGFGFQLVNLRNVNGTNGDRTSVRIASPIYTVRHVAKVDYRAGVRGLSYHTCNTSNGELVDRNVGALNMAVK